MSDVLVVLLVAVGSYALRTSFIVFAGQRTLPPTIVGVLDNVKPAALAALATTAAISHEALTLTHVVALGITALAAYRGADLLGALIPGLLALAIGNLVF